MRLNTGHAVTNELRAAISGVAYDAMVADIVFRGTQESDDLEHAERFRFSTT